MCLTDALFAYETYAMSLSTGADNYIIMPMTHAPETDTSFLVPVSGAGFWCVCHLA